MQVRSPTLLGFMVAHKECAKDFSFGFFSTEAVDLRWHLVAFQVALLRYSALLSYFSTEFLTAYICKESRILNKLYVLLLCEVI